MYDKNTDKKTYSHMIVLQPGVSMVSKSKMCWKGYRDRVSQKEGTWVGLVSKNLTLSPARPKAVSHLMIFQPIKTYWFEWHDKYCSE